jgi:hypothetical protein
MRSAAAHLTRYVSVDSRDRDHGAWESAARFDVELSEEIRDVHAFQLRSLSVPLVYPVAQGRDCLHVAQAGMPGGGAAVRAPYRYTGPADRDAYLTRLGDALTTAGAELWAATSSGNMLVLSSSAPFSVSSTAAGETTADGYDPTSAARALGLPRGTTHSSATLPVVAAHPNVAVGAHVLALDVPETAYLHIEHMHAMEATLRASGRGCEMSHEVLRPGGDLAGRPSAYYQHAEAQVVKRFHPPMARLRRLAVRLLDYHGAPLRLDNREISFDAMVVSLPGARGAGAGYGPNEQR